MLSLTVGELSRSRSLIEVAVLLIIRAGYSAVSLGFAFIDFGVDILFASASIDPGEVKGQVFF